MPVSRRRAAIWDMCMCSGAGEVGDDRRVWHGGADIFRLAIGWDGGGGVNA